MADGAVIAVGGTVGGLKSRSLGWQLGLSAYWFATSMKWFLLLNAILSSQVEQLVPGGDRGKAWGAVVMIGATWAMIGPALFGYLSDRTRSRFGRWRPYLAVGSALTVVALMTLSGAKSYAMIVLGYFLLQLSDDVATGPYSALIPSLVPAEQRGRASGIMGLLNLLAQVAGGISIFVLSGDLTRIYLMLAVVNLMCAATTLIVVREEPGTAGGGEGASLLGRGGKTTGPAPLSPRPLVPSPAPGFLAGWIEPWRSPDFRWVWFTRFLNALGFYLVLTYLRFYMVDVVGEFRFFGWTIASVDPDAADPRDALRKAATLAVSVLALVISVTGAFSALIGGKAADRVGRKKVIYVAGALMTMVLPPFIFFPDYTVILLLGVLFGVGYGAYQSADWALVSDVMPSRESLAKDMGIWQASVATPQIFSGAVGSLVDWGNAYRPGFGYTFTFLFAGLAFTLGTVLVSRVKGSR